MGDELILRVINHGKVKPVIPSSPPGNGWVEWAVDTGLKPDYNSAYWTVPHMPVGASSGIIDFIFIGESPSGGGGKIIQPVLRRDQYGWTGAAWYVWNSGSNWYKSDDIDCDEGDTILGELVYDWNDDTWDIKFTNVGYMYTYILTISTGFGPRRLVWTRTVLGTGVLQCIR